MANLIKLARPFAKRRSIYRQKMDQASAAAFRCLSGSESEQELLARADRFEMAAEAIDYMWFDLKETT